jgi:arylsulfatase A
MNYSRNLVLGFVFLGVATFFSCSKQPYEQKPNIIFIMADDMGYNDLGCYGASLIETPNIDKLASEGIMFNRFYAGSSVCAPSRSVLMTGLHTGHGPIRGNMQVEPSGQMPLPAGTTTLASKLKEAGYQTALIGKWGLGIEGSEGEPSNHGFDYYFGYLDQVLAHNHYPGFLIKNGEKVFLNNDVHYLDSSHWSKGLGSYPLKKNDYSQDRFTKAALTFIEKNKEQPFFLYLPVIIPHDNGEALNGKRYSEVPSFGIYTDSIWTEEEKGYAAMITHLDHEMGLIVQKLDELGLNENTLLIFTSDNGGDSPGKFRQISNYPFRGFKRDLYEGGVRVPFLARWSGKIKAGSTSDHISAFWDLMPTFCEIAGVELNETTDGISFFPELTRKTQQHHQYLYWEFHEGNKSQAVLLGDWKGVRVNLRKKPDAPLELYNLASDPGETNDLALLYPQIVDSILQIIMVARVDDKNWPLFD